ncbi:phage tail tube protein [Romboutsia sp. 1001285H_161024_C4]|uniref:phage tail tube protein n=1 Tax=Romboutsia sp. 1001285H_161024_C4 TaxID=2787109 RepID=UPI00189A684C|nr:phage tail tube protein [Romboutsia sp. 1001285H_161024_C4]
MKNFDFRNVINGSHGMLWLDGDEMAEVIAFQAKDTYDKEEIRKARSMITGYKITGIKRKGSIKMHHVDSTLIRKIAKVVESGKTPVFTIVSKLDDPDALGNEHVQLGGVVFDELTIADWENGVNGTIEAPFTYETYTPLNLI